jgi:hypothetical protein
MRQFAVMKGSPLCVAAWANPSSVDVSGTAEQVSGNGD